MVRLQQTKLTSILSRSPIPHVRPLADAELKMPPPPPPATDDVMFEVGDAVSEAGPLSRRSVIL
jgi:hypothetical protein